MPIISVGFYIQIYIENSKYKRTGRNILEYFAMLRVLETKHRTSQQNILKFQPPILQVSQKY